VPTDFKFEKNLEKTLKKRMKSACFFLFEHKNRLYFLIEHFKKAWYDFHMNFKSEIHVKWRACP